MKLGKSFAKTRYVSEMLLKFCYFGVFEATGYDLATVFMSPTFKIEKKERLAGH